MMNRPRRRSRSVSQLALIAAVGSVGTGFGCAGRVEGPPAPHARHSHAAAAAHPHDHTRAHAHTDGHARVYHLGASATATAEDLTVAAAEMAAAADKFLASLSPELRKKAVYEMTDDERLNWHFVPKPRNGVPLKEMNDEQRKLAHALLQTGVSHKGYEKTAAVIDLENVLRVIENRPEVRDPELYYFTVFGKPDPTGTWGWRVEGHHASLNFTVVDGKPAAGAPAFLGANPAKVLEGPKQGLRVMAEEEDMGRALVKALSDEQRKEAVISDMAPDDVLTAAARKAEIGEPKGIAFSSLKPEQQEMLTSLIEFYAHRLRESMAELDLDEIDKAGRDKVRFAWAGSLEPGQRHYYRIHGPTFLVEYDNTQNNANHVHTVWRDLENDFGGDLLKAHYEDHDHDKEHGHDAAAEGKAE